MSAATDVRAALEDLLGAAAVDARRPRFDGPELPCAHPADEEQAAAVLRAAGARGWRVVPTGRGSKLGWTPPAARADLLLATDRLRGVVAHVPDDGTLTALGGTGLDELRARAREGGHWLTPDVPHPGTSTLGGTLAAAQSGPDRMRFGPLRNHVLGTRVLLASGQASRSGGRLVKNVTGFDLSKLWCGSHGTLALVVEATLRLFPAPELERTVMSVAADARELAELTRAARALPLRTTSLVAGRTDPPTEGAGWALFAQLGGRRVVVEAETEALLAAWPRAHVTDGPEETERVRDLAFRPAEGLALHVGFPPSATVAVLDALEAGLGQGPCEPRWIVQPGVALADVLLRPRADEPVPELAARLRALRARLAPLRAHVSVREAPAALCAKIEVLDAGQHGGEAARALAASLSRALDPEGVFATGRL